MTMQTVRMLWFAMTMAQVAFLAIAFVVPPAGNGAPPLALVGAMAVAALSIGGASVVVPTLLRPKVEERLSVLAADPAQDRAALRQAVLSGLLPVFLVGCALSEAVSVLGLALAFQGANPGVFVPFVAAGVMLLAMRFPTEARFFGSLADAVREVT